HWNPSFFSFSKIVNPKQFIVLFHFITPQLKSEIEYATSKHFKEFRAVEYCDKIVDGKYYIITVRVLDDACIFLEVYKSLPVQTPDGLRKFTIGWKILEENRAINDPLKP
uniref:Cystatin domain-containing protein n=1 Tax=Cyprinodon variegatus TaxID=28743 RepID=A0A3Q2GML2_CYPVA